MPIGEIRFARVNIDAPPSRIRRYHKRSRLGCDNCKRRRVKCNEQAPTCDACAKEGVKCIRTRLSLVHPRSSEGANTNSIETKLSTTQIVHFNIDMVPLRLLYHFEHQTLDTLALGSTFWKDILRLAFEVAIPSADNSSLLTKC